VAAAAPDLVIHLGDLSLDGARDPAGLTYGRRLLDQLPVPWRAVPGNHDIGDNPQPGGPDGLAADESRRQRWLETVGPDYWSLTLPGWTLLALNAQLPGSGLAAEAGQWSWLQDQVSQTPGDRQVALLSHRPLAAPEAELAPALPPRRSSSSRTGWPS
jgi:3',5'-cyclic AMP phosphodiesterase CpdA